MFLIETAIISVFALVLRTRYELVYLPIHIGIIQGSRAKPIVVLFTVASYLAYYCKFSVQKKPEHISSGFWLQPLKTDYRFLFLNW